MARLTIIRDSISEVSLPDNKEESDYKDKLNELMLQVSKQEEVIRYIVSLQKMIETMEEIRSNGLIGQYSVDDTGCLVYQLQRTSDMRYIIETTKTDAGTRKIPITEDVAQMFQAIIEDRVPPKVEKVIDGYSGFLFYDENDMPLVAMHWQHRFNHMVGRYNDIYRVQMPNITPHVCRHTYCSNMAKSGMNPKILQYLMGHSDISVTMNVYTHIGFDDAEEELKRMEEFRKAQTEIEKKNEKPMSQKMFKVI